MEQILHLYLHIIYYTKANTLHKFYKSWNNKYNYLWLSHKCYNIHINIHLIKIWQIFHPNIRIIYCTKAYNFHNKNNKVSSNYNSLWLAHNRYNIHKDIYLLILFTVIFSSLHVNFFQKYFPLFCKILSSNLLFFSYFFKVNSLNLQKNLLKVYIV